MYFISKIFFKTLCYQKNLGQFFNFFNSYTMFFRVLQKKLKYHHLSELYSFYLAQVNDHLDVVLSAEAAFQSCS